MNDPLLEQAETDDGLTVHERQEFANLEQTIAKVEAEIRRVSGGRHLRLVDSPTSRYHGLVLAQRPGGFQPFVVWRWATHLSDDSPVQTETGAMLWTGSYCETRAEAEAEFVRRLPTIY